MQKLPQTSRGTMSRGRRHELAYLCYWPVRASFPCMATQSLPKSAFCSDILHITHTRQVCCLQQRTPAAEHCRLLRHSEELKSRHGASF